MIFGAALLLALLLSACGGGDDAANADAAAEPDQEQAADVDADSEPDDGAGPDGQAGDGEGRRDADETPSDADEPPAEGDEPADEPADAEEDAAADGDVAEPADGDAEPAAPRDRSNLLLQASEFPQTDPSFAEAEIPHRPDDFADYGRVALPWLQTRSSVEEILPLFVAWGMPPVAGGFRLNLVDTDGDALLPDDGRSAIVIIYTDPPTAERATGYSNLVVYEPLPDSPGRFQIVYDHNQVEQSFGAASGRTGIAVTSVADVNADGLRDITFEELVCDGSGCTRVQYVLSNTGAGYLRVLN